MSLKVSFVSRKVLRQYTAIVAVISAVASFYFIVVEIPVDQRSTYVILASVALILIYLVVWVVANFAQRARLNVNGSSVFVKVGDIFKEKGLKTIAFNEYFDTQADDVLISKSSLNGQYVLKKNANQIANLDTRIANDTHLKGSIASRNSKRSLGKKIKYDLGSIYVDGDYLLTAFSRFDNENRAFLSLKDYIACMLNFWDEVDRVYANRSVAVPLMGSGITRIKDADVQPQELLQLLLWTFKISRVKFKHPANATIVIHKSLADKINFYDLS